MNREQRELQLNGFIRTDRGRAEISKLHDKLSGKFGNGLDSAGLSLSEQIDRILEIEYPLPSAKSG